MADDAHERLATLLRALPVGVFETDTEGLCSYVNDRWCELFGITAEDARGTGWARGIAREDRALVFGEWSAAASEQRPFDLEFRVRRPDGTMRWVRSRASAVVDADGHVRGFLGTVEDITPEREAARVLEAERRRFREVIDLAPVGIFETDRSLEIQTTNAAMREALGPMRHTVGDGVHPDDLGPVTDVVLRSMARGDTFAIRFRYDHPVKGERWMDVTGRTVVGADGGLDRLVGVMRDVTEDLATQRAAARFRELFEALPDPAAITDLTGRISFLNQAGMLYATTAPPSSLRDLCFDDQSLSTITGDAWPTLLREGVWAGEVRLTPALHVDIPLSVVLQLHDTAGDDPFVSLVSRDISAQKLAERTLAEQATHDPLTGLANRSLLADAIHRAVSRVDRGDSTAAVLFIDLDHFKPVNDTLGHAAGDAVLRGVAARIQETVREGDLVARLGGDEFVVLCEPLDSESHAEQIAQRIVEAVATPFHIGDADVRVGASVGVAVLRAGLGVDEVLREADAAVYDAKRTGRGRVVAAAR